MVALLEAGVFINAQTKTTKGTALHCKRLTFTFRQG